MISNIIDKIRLLFVTEKEPFLQLKNILGFYPRNIKLYRLALMHKSVAYYERERMRCEMRQQKHKGIVSGLKGKNGSLMADFNRALTINNERLEFLGDAMLGAIVADILYKHYNNKQEGFLTSLRSKLVCRRSLNQLAVDLGLDKLILHTGAVTTGHNSYMNGNAFEAFVGAIYLDRGYDYCYRFLEDKVFGKHIDIDKVAKSEENFKSALIEWCQRYKFQFEFRQQEIRDEADPSTPMFRCSVCIEGMVCGTDDGYSKKEGDQKSAKIALKAIKKDKVLVESIRMAAKQRRNPQTKEEMEDNCIESCAM